MSYRIDEAEIRRAIELYLKPGQVTELRVLNCRVKGERRTGTFSGYFDREHVADLIAACRQIEDASATYFIPNPCKPALLARAHNRARLVSDKDATANHDILERIWLLIDVDANRPAKVSATPEEREAARRLITDIDYHLWERGFPAGIICDSGNGWHLTLPVDLRADDKGWTERLLKHLAAEFNNEMAHVDVTVHNAARIWKLPGTEVRKGDNCPQLRREWSMARIVTVCSEAPRC